MVCLFSFSDFYPFLVYAFHLLYYFCSALVFLLIFWVIRQRWSKQLCSRVISTEGEIVWCYINKSIGVDGLLFYFFVGHWWRTRRIEAHLWYHSGKNGYWCQCPNGGQHCQWSGSWEVLWEHHWWVKSFL